LTIKGDEMNTKVAKFGGSSLADVNQIAKVIQIINSDPSRRIVVVSAPGKRFSKDEKVTDMLYRWHQLFSEHGCVSEITNLIIERYLCIVKHFGLKLDIGAEVDRIGCNVLEGASVDYLVSRGEYLMAKILAELLCCEFVDPAKYIRLFIEADMYELEPSFYSLVQGANKVVIPGFYGSGPDGKIKTFSRGGSDVTGAIVASASKASVYENWTDVSGILVADPKIVTNPKSIRNVTYEELRELAYMGANVFHEEAMFPVMDAGIPTNIRNTNCPDDEGTWIVSDSNSSTDSTVSGIAGRKGFSVIKVKKRFMNKEIGFGRKILHVLEKNLISFEHMPGGIDTVSIIIDSKVLPKEKSAKVLDEIRQECSTQDVEVQHALAMIAVVGRGMVQNIGMAARVLGAIADAGINIKVINQGTSELSIIIGVDNNDYENAIRALHKSLQL